jgi:hypothetical protein
MMDETTDEPMDELPLSGRAEEIARGFDRLPFRMQQSGGLALAISEAIKGGTTAEDWARSVRWPAAIHLYEDG